MNASFVMISVLVKSNLSDKSLISALYSIDSNLNLNKFMLSVYYLLKFLC